MKDFLKNHGLWILFAGAVIAVALALLSYFSTNASPLVDLANTIIQSFSGSLHLRIRLVHRQAELL